MVARRCTSQNEVGKSFWCMCGRGWQKNICCVKKKKKVEKEKKQKKEKQGTINILCIFTVCSFCLCAFELLISFCLY